MKSIKGLENQRWFIWTIVAIIVILGGTATYVWYVGQTVDWGANGGLMAHHPKQISQYQSTSSASSTSLVDPYANIVDIGTADQLTIPGKYSCNIYSVTEPSNDQPDNNMINYPNSLVFQPSGTLLIRAQTSQSGYSTPYDVTFSKNCTYLYYINTLDNHIHAIDLSTGAKSTLTIPSSVFPSSDLIPQAGYPTLDFLYSIDDSHLLLDFLSGSGYTIAQSEAIYDTSTGKVTFINTDTGNDGQEVLLDYGTNTLIVFKIENTSNTVRTEINLETGTTRVSSITQLTADPLNYDFPAGYCGITVPGNPYVDITQAQYITCRDNWISQLLK